MLGRWLVPLPERIRHLISHDVVHGATGSAFPPPPSASHQQRQASEPRPALCPLQSLSPTWHTPSSSSLQESQTSRPRSSSITTRMSTFPSPEGSVPATGRPNSLDDIWPGSREKDSVGLPTRTGLRSSCGEMRRPSTTTASLR